MKKYILLLLAATIAATAIAQTNYYDGQTIYIDSTITFKCHKTGVIMSLENIHDPLIGADEMYPANMNPRRVEILAAANMRFLSNQAFLNAFHETFTASELAAMANSSISLSMTVNNQGNIVNLAFIFYIYPYYLTIPPQKFATLYKKLKAYVKVYVQYPQINYWGMGGEVMINDVIANRRLFSPERYVYR